MTAHRSILAVAACCTALAGAVPATAGAYATVAPPSSAPGVAGLPDGRVYEEVSPANKHGNQVLGDYMPAFAESDGEAILYEGTGPLGEVASNASGLGDNVQVSRRTAHGWATRSVMPLAAPGTGVGGEEENTNGVSTVPTWFDVARSDLSQFAFGTWGDGAFVGPPDESHLPNNFFLAGSDPFSEPQWIARPQVAGPPSGLESNGTFTELFIAGGSPDLKTLYFFYEGALLPGASRLYEYRNGVLSDAGVLPGEEASPSWAAPAAQPLVERHEFRGFTAPAGFDNEVSGDGSRLFFTREDGAGTPELYVRITTPEGAHRTLLVSQSQVPGHRGEAAPSGPLAMASTEPEYTGGNEAAGQASPPSSAFASPDGSHVFFQSTDRLTAAAPEDATAKTYDFDVDTESLEYLPSVTGSIISSTQDGSSLVFENTASTPFELDRWSGGAGGGSVTSIAQLPAAATSDCGEVVCVGPAYTSSDGTDVVFSTESPIAGFNDRGSHPPLGPEGLPEPGSSPLPNKQIFRYDAVRGDLSCISCPPSTETPSSNAVISFVDQRLNGSVITGGLATVQDDHGMSTGGDRVFFDTADSLVPQDVNGVRDVYEWENGTIFLISSGRSTDASYFLDASENGDDAFFSTTEGIAPGDTDGGRDVYDARIPRPGDNPPPAAVPCQGDVCQGPPNAPNLLGAPASATFSGLGNLVQQPAATPKAKAKAKPKAKAKKKKKTKPKQKTKHQRKQASKALRAKKAGRYSRHSNRRSN
jgi:hypothetical protein